MMTRGTGARCCETPPGVNHGLLAAITELGSLLRPALGSHAREEVADLVGSRAGPDMPKSYVSTGAPCVPCPARSSHLPSSRPNGEAGQGLEDKVDYR